ncbi:MAG: transcriptional regulator YeiL [Erysipelotrichaceae bacterium]|nr:transcriptional regulator YeiL [Erysipelotrichaceae bacterium]
MEKIYEKNVIRQYLNRKGYRNWFSHDFDDAAYLVRCRHNEILIRQGDEADTLYYLVKGKCRATAVNSEGKLCVINTITAPNLIGEIEFISEDDSFSVEAVEDSLLIALPYEACRDMLLNDPKFLFHLCELLTEKEREHAIKLTQAASFPLENRLAQFLLENAINKEISLRKTVIAESLGVSYRHLEKVMKDFVEQGILKKEKFVYTITDEKELLDKASALDIF